MFESTGERVELPRHLVKVTIRNLKIGETAFAKAVALLVDDEHRCYLKGHYEIYQERTGPEQIEISHTDDGFYVKVPRGVKFTIDSFPLLDRSIPVVRVIEEETQD